MNDFYVYRYIRLDTNTPFYVGKGKSKRAYRMDSHNNFCKRIAQKYGYEVEFIFKDLTEEQAFTKEIEFIKLYKSIGYCEANLTNGGEGNSGLVMSNEQKAKISASLKGIKRSIESSAKGAMTRTGMKRSTETKVKISNAHKGKISPLKGKTLSKEHGKNISLAKKGKPNSGNYKKVQCIETKEIFMSIRHGAESLGITPKTLSANIKLKTMNKKTNCHFIFI